MSLRCALFGHAPAKNISERSRLGGGDYATDVRGPYIDGIGRQHFDLIVACPRCGERYTACKIHGEWITKLMVNEDQNDE